MAQAAQATQTLDPREHAVLAHKLDALGPYRLLDVIGEGGMGAVYRAEQTHPVRREVAIKVTRIDLGAGRRIARFEAERQILATLSHPNIARVFDAGDTSDGFPYLVMEFIRGQPIDQYCNDLRLSVAARVELLAEACEALTHAHQHGILHRDVKPANLLIDVGSSRPIPKLIDFGIARLMHGDAPAMTQTGFSVGTPAYMSPEQARGEADIDTRTDVYALGVTLYLLLTGSLPPQLTPAATATSPAAESAPRRPSRALARLPEEDAEHIAARYQLARRELIGTLARDLDWIVVKATQADRSKRYATVEAFADDLRRYLGGFPLSAAPPSVFEVTRKFIARHRVETLAVVILLLALFGSLALVANAWRAERQALAKASAQLRQHEAFNAFAIEVIKNAQPSRPGQPVTLMDAMAHAGQLAAQRYQDDPNMRAALQELLFKSMQGQEPPPDIPAPTKP